MSEQPQIIATMYIGGIFKRHVRVASPDGHEHTVDIYAIDEEKAYDMINNFTRAVAVYKTRKTSTISEI